MDDNMELKDNKLCEGKKELTEEYLEQVTGGQQFGGDILYEH